MKLLMKIMPFLQRLFTLDFVDHSDEPVLCKWRGCARIDDESGDSQIENENPKTNMQ